MKTRKQYLLNVSVLAFSLVIPGHCLVLICLLLDHQLYTSVILII